MSYAIPDTYHTLWQGGLCFFIDDVTRKEIETFLASDPKPYDHITVDTLAGEELTVIADGVNAIASSSPETRTLERQVRDRLEQEDAL